MILRTSGFIILVLATFVRPVAAQEDEERFVAAFIGHHASSDGGSSVVFGGGYYIKVMPTVLLSADVGVKFLEKTIFGIAGNEVTWFDITANARYLLAPTAPVKPFIGIGVGYGPVTVSDKVLKNYGVTLQGSTSALALLGIAGIRIETESNLCLHAEARIMTAGFPIEGAVKQDINLDGYEFLAGLQLRL